MAPKFRSPDEPALIQGRLDVPEFVKARVSEIKRLEAAMEGSRSSGKKRAFQQLPRRLRRRTASHNAKRVPRRLRERAQYELERDNAVIKPKSKRTIKKAKVESAVIESDIPAPGILASPPKSGRYAKRQEDKVWLPTHIWHKKRAHLEKLWDFMIPISPSQKQYRATHRVLSNLGSNGAMVWDKSYYATIVFRSDAVKKLHNAISQVFPGAQLKLYTTLGRSWQGLLNLGPQANADDSDADVKPTQGPALVSWLSTNSLVVQVHPLLFQRVWDHFAGMNKWLDMIDYRFAVGSIDVAGPQALAALRASLIPLPGPSRDLWEILPGLGSVEALPTRATVALEVHDPRLSFPPRHQRPRGTPEKWTDALASWPSGLQKQDLFTDSVRLASIRAMETQAAIDARKKPGQHVEVNPDTDPRIPISMYVLNDGRVRVLLPRIWTLPVWLSLTHLPNVLIGGLDQSRQLCFEKGLPHFPEDYPWTVDGAASLEKAKEAARKAKSASREPTPTKESSLSKLASESIRESPVPVLGDPLTAEFDLFAEDEELKPVTIKCQGRGTPTTNARIFSPRRNGQLSYGNLIGFITTGNFNLHEAVGTGVGSCIETGSECLIVNVGSDTPLPATVNPVKAFPL